VTRLFLGSLVSAIALCVAGCGLVLDVSPAAGDLDAAPRDTAVGMLDGGNFDAPLTDAGGGPLDANRTDSGGGDAAGGTDGDTVRDAASRDGSVGRLPIGAACGADSDCESTYCYDVHLSNVLCYGTTCALACTAETDCQAFLDAAGIGSTGALCVRHSVGDDFVCDFSWTSFPSDVTCE